MKKYGRLESEWQYILESIGTPYLNAVITINTEILKFMLKKTMLVVLGKALVALSATKLAAHELYM